MGWLSKFYRDEEFLDRMESSEARDKYLVKLIKSRTISLLGLAIATVVLIASWFDNTSIVVFFGVLLVNMDLDQKVKFTKWVIRRDGESEAEGQLR